MKLDPKLLKFMTKEQFRVLSAVEQGSKNHYLVPLELIVSIAGLRHGGARKIVNQLLRNKLVARNSKKYEGYRLTYLGYDFLALRVFLNRGVITAVGRQIGVGKESDIFLVQNDKKEEFALKIHRLGRVSFKAVKEKRDYLEGRFKSNWLYLSRLAATKEFAFMKALHQNGFPVPTPIDQNRHCVVMSLCQGYSLYQVKKMHNADTVYKEMMDIIVRFARCGLIHCDFNEFNLMVNDEGKVTVIDFPQMVSIEHENAEMYFDRDVQCIRKFFGKILGADVSDYPKWNTLGKRLRTLDSEVRASGFTEKAAKEFDKLMALQKETLVEEEDGTGEKNVVAVDGRGGEKGRDAEEDEDNEAIVGKVKDLRVAEEAENVGEASESVDLKTSEEDIAKHDDVVARLRTQRRKQATRARNRRAANRNRNKQRGKKDLKRGIRASLKSGGGGW